MYLSMCIYRIRFILGTNYIFVNLRISLITENERQDQKALLHQGVMNQVLVDQ